MKTILIFLLMSFIPFSYNLYAQGCSDAGICTVNSLKPASHDSLETTKYNHIKFGVSYGKADHSISVINSYLEYNRQLSSDFSIDTKILFTHQNGKENSVSGLSDIFLNLNYTFTENALLMIGSKIPLSNGNDKFNGMSLPMDFQSSLGTFDFIAGIGYRISNIHFVIALQQPLTHNKNQFLAESFQMDSPYFKFQSTNGYKRKGDLMLRVSYFLKLSERINFIAGLLPIYHLGDDEFTDINGNNRIIAGSKGITLNGTAFLDYALDDSNNLQINFGLPFIVRDTRPEGLTRSFVTTMEYRLRF